MLSHRQEQLRRAAARETIARIRQDHQRASKRLKPLLAHIEANLFNRGLQVREMLRVCGVRDKAIATLFHSEIGRSPWLYITRRRLEVAKRLLLETDLRSWQIAELVAYGEQRSLARAFKKQFAEAPRDYRQRERPQAGGQLAVEPEPPPFDDAAFEQHLAEKIWRHIRSLAPAARRRAIRNQIPLTTPALFDLLREKSREEGRDNRKRGVQLAKLALDSLDLCARSLGAEIHDLKARGWAWLANARRLALDFRGAEEAFSRAEKEWGMEREEKDRLVEGEICDLHATLKMNQRDFNEALALENRAITIFKSTNNRPMLAKAYALRASITCYRGKSAASVPDLLRALDLLEDQDSQQLVLSVRCNLAGIYAMNGNFDEASAALPAARSLAANASSRLYRYQILWTEGLIARGNGRLESADALLIKARAGFLEIGETDHAGVVSIDLAIVNSELGRASRAMELALYVLSVFGSMNIHREAVAGLQLLRDSVTKQNVPLAVLRQARSCLEEARQDAALRG